jgi:hypothetical protein
LQWFETDVQVISQHVPSLNRYRQAEKTITLIWTFDNLFLFLETLLTHIRLY